MASAVELELHPEARKAKSCAFAERQTGHQHLAHTNAHSMSISGAEQATSVASAQATKLCGETGEDPPQCCANLPKHWRCQDWKASAVVHQAAHYLEKHTFWLACMSMPTSPQPKVLVPVGSHSLGFKALSFFPVI